MKNVILIVTILVRCNNKDVVLNVSKDDQFIKQLQCSTSIMMSYQTLSSLSPFCAYSEDQMSLHVFIFFCKEQKENISITTIYV